MSLISMVLSLLKSVVLQSMHVVHNCGFLNNCEML